MRSSFGKNLMNQQQASLRDLVVELLQAESKRGSISQRDFVLKNLPGIEDGRFFDLPVEVQLPMLFWLNESYFGRGEGERCLVEEGFLRRDLGSDYNRELREYAYPEDTPTNPLR